MTDDQAATAAEPDDLPDAALPAAADYIRDAAAELEARAVTDKPLDQMSADEIRAAVGAGVPGAAKAYAETHRILCAHADQDGRAAHWLEPGEKCPDAVIARLNAELADPQLEAGS
jgi:hypothetical protein